jgi:hypothetical protein
MLDATELPLAVVEHRKYRDCTDAVQACQRHFYRNLAQGVSKSTTFNGHWAEDHLHTVALNGIGGGPCRFHRSSRMFHLGV